MASSSSLVSVPDSDEDVPIPLANLRNAVSNRAQLAQVARKIIVDQSLFEAACLSHCLRHDHEEGYCENCKYRRPSALEWIEFRKHIYAKGTVTLGTTDKIIVADVGGKKLLIKKSNGLPICTFPSCCSTFGTNIFVDNRCNRHIGTIKFAAMELEFHADKNTIAWENLCVMFLHYSIDTPSTIRRKMILEYQYTEHIQATEKRLRERKLFGPANKLRATADAEIPLKRYWIYNDVYQAVAKISILSTAIMTVLSPNNRKGVVLNEGRLAGKRLILVDDGIETPCETPGLLEDIKIEQMERFGFCVHFIMTEFDIDDQDKD